MRTLARPSTVVLACFLWLAPPTTALEFQTHRIPMRDGALIYVSVVFPGDPQIEGPWPVTLRRNVYGRDSSIDAFLNVFDGYVAVIGELRGRGDNDGEFRFYEDDGWGELQDGVDTLQWILDQPWCNGRVGTIGGSALGMAQILLAGASQDLTCQVIEAAPSNFYAHFFYQGGVLRKALVEQSEFLLGDSKCNEANWRSHPLYDDYWRQFDADARAESIATPALHIGGWWDTFQKATIDHYTARQLHGGDGARGRQRLILRATTHAPFPPLLPFDLPEPLQIFTATIEDSSRFFETELKGVDNGILDESPVKYYVVGDDTAHSGPGWEWRAANHWPPFPFEPTPYYLDPNGQLTTTLDAVPPTQRSFDFDPDHPVPSLGGADLFGYSDGHYFSWGPWDQRKVSDRPDVLRFVTPPLDQPLEITGPVTARLFISSDAVDTDFTAKLVDIYPPGDGREMLMLDGIQRVKFRAGYETPLPALTPNDIVEVEIDLWAISLIFNTGHRIGVFISSSNYPRFEVNPNNGDDFPGEHPPAIAHNTVYLGPDYPSALLLPVRYPERDTDGDGLPDAWEYRNGLDPASALGDNGPDGEPDNNGFTNREELQRGSHPLIPEGQEPTPGCHGSHIPLDTLPLTATLLTLRLLARKPKRTT